MNFFHLKGGDFPTLGIPHAKERFTGSCVTNRLRQVKPTSMKYKRLKSSSLNACLAAAVLASIPALSLKAETAVETKRLENLEKENDILKKRLEALEDLAVKEGLVAKGDAPGAVKALGDITMTGFVTASYFWDTADNEAGNVVGNVWNNNNGSFSINKVKLTLASAPVEASGDEFDFGYKVSLIFGEDAPMVNTGGVVQGFDELREAYVEMNVPIGTGLNVRAGQLISLLNYESGDGGAVNDNFSQGYQWFFTGNGPSAGVQLGYAFTDKVDFKVRVQNGMYAGPVDGNINKAVMGAVGIKPTENLWFSLIGFSSREGAGSVRGGSLLAGFKATDKLGFGAELDYFDFDGTGVGGSTLTSAGLWTSYAFTEKVGLGIRAEYLNDSEGAGTGGVGPAGFAFAANAGQEIASVAVTLNIKPVPYIKIQPEVRFDNSSLGNAFGTTSSRFLVGAGISYLF